MHAPRSPTQALRPAGLSSGRKDYFMDRLSAPSECRVQALYAAWSRILRPTRKCGPCGFRWPRHGRSSLKRWSGYSHTKGRVMRTARDQDDPKSRLEAPPMQCPRCETRPLADLYVRRDHSPVPSPSLVRSEKQRAPKCRVQAFTSRTNHLNCCRNNTSIATTWSILGPAQRDRGNASWLESPFQRFANPPALTL